MGSLNKWYRAFPIPFCNQVLVNRLFQIKLALLRRMANYKDDVTEDFVSLTYDPIQFEFLTNQVRLKRAGAVSSFLGTTRDFFEDKQVTSLDYESYPDMAIEVMKSMCQTIRQKWNVCRIVIQHKLGSCPVGEISIAIVISSEHRNDSLEAVSFAINELKKIVPIWKKEIFADGDSVWKENADYTPIK